MSYKAHKDPCGVIGCPQFLCMDASKDLRAEVEALRKDKKAQYDERCRLQSIINKCENGDCPSTEKAEAEIETLKQEDSENLKILFAEREGRRKAEAENAELKKELQIARQAIEVKQPGFDMYYHQLFSEQMALRKKAETEAMALALECKEKTEAMLNLRDKSGDMRSAFEDLWNHIPENQTERRLRLWKINERFVSAFVESDPLVCRPDSFWTLRAEAMLKPTPLVLYCPQGHGHIDEGEWATKPHKTHQCQFVTDAMDHEICGEEWRPSNHPTVGVAAIDSIGEENK